MGILAEVVQISIFFVLLFTSSASFITISTQLFEQLGVPYLGQLTLFTTYGSFMLWCLVAPFIGKRVNYKKMLVIAAIGDMLSYSSCVLLHYTGFHPAAIVVLELSTILDGLTCTLLWIAQAGYIHYTCQANGLHHKKGYYFGLFFAIYGICNLTSALITSFMLGFFEVVVYFWMLEGLSVVTVLYSLFFIIDVQKKYGALPQIQALQAEENKEPPEKMLPAIARVFKFYPKMIPLLPSIGLVGISIAFYASSLHKILEMAMPPDSERGYVSMRTGIMFLVLGFGEIIGGYSAGDLSDKIGVQKVGTIALASYTLAVTTSLLAVTYHETVVPVMFAAFFWGFQEAFIQNWITVVCSRTYKGALEAFVINKQFHSLTMCLYELMLIVWYPPMEIIIPVLIFLVVPSVIAIPFIEEGDAPPVPIFEDKVLPIAYSEPHLR